MAHNIDTMTHNKTTDSKALVGHAQTYGRLQILR